MVTNDGIGALPPCCFMNQAVIDNLMSRAEEEIGAPPIAIGHSSNLVGLPTGFLANLDFNEDPREMHVSGAREFNRQLFEMLRRAKDPFDAAVAFDTYMTATFGLDAEQAKGEPSPHTRRHRVRSSYVDLLKGWSLDSNGPAGAVLKGWVESRFGLFPTYHKTMICRVSSPAWTTYIEEKMSSLFGDNSIPAQIDLLYEFCQWSCSHFGIGTAQPLTLHCGTDSFEEHQIALRLDQTHVVMRLNNLASFTQDRDVAGSCGKVILTVRVPSVKLLAFDALLPMHVLSGGSEYLVIGGDFLAEVSAS